MRYLIGLVLLGPLVACKGASPSAADAGSDALPPPPQAAPCGALGLPGPALTAVTGSVVRLADVDGDGRLDLIVVGGWRVGQGVVVYPGTGDASFGAGIDAFAVGSNNSAVVIADLNGDGKPDVVLAESYDSGGYMEIALGDGTGHFQLASSYPAEPLSTSTSTSSTAVAVGDLDGDGRPDLVLTRPGAGSVEVRLGHGDGTFGDATAYPVGRLPAAVAIADLDGDGKLDVIVANYQDATVSILEGSGDGTFKAKLDRATTGSPNNLATADLNGDGKVDLIVRGLSLSILMNDGTGAVRDHVDYPLDLQIGMYGALAVGDVTGDGEPDVVAIGGANLVVFAGKGDGTVRPATVAMAISPQFTQPGAQVALGDLNGDSAIDVVVSSPGLYRVSVALNDSNAGWRSPTTYAMGASSSVVAAADVNGDGYVDLVLTGSSSVDIALGRSEGKFLPLVHYPVNGPSGPASVLDVNGDGRADLVVQSAAGVSVLLGAGDGAFLAAVDSPMSITRFAVGDLSGDGRPDLVVANEMGSFLYVGNGDGTFDSGTKLSSKPALVTFATGMALGDLDGDGRLDVVVTYAPLCAEGCPTSTNAAVLLNRATGFVATSLLVGGQELSPAIADLDHDGKLDLVTASNLFVRVRLGNGDGTMHFGETLLFPVNDRSVISQLVDITGDGKLDIIAVRASGDVSIFPGNGDATFGSMLTYPSNSPTGFAFSGFAVADIDRDGRLDVITPGDTFDVLFARCVR